MAEAGSPKMSNNAKTEIVPLNLLLFTSSSLVPLPQLSQRQVSSQVSYDNLITGLATAVNSLPQIRYNAN